MSKQRTKVYDFICQNPGHTRPEIARGLNIKERSVCGRASELKNLSMIRESDQTKNGFTKLYPMPQGKLVMEPRESKFNVLKRLIRQFSPDKYAGIIEKFNQITKKR